MTAHDGTAVIAALGLGCAGDPSAPGGPADASPPAPPTWSSEMTADASRVPQLPGHLMFNAWHAGEHWFGGGAPPDYPAGDAVLRVDRAAYGE